MMAYGKTLISLTALLFSIGCATAADTAAAEPADQGQVVTADANGQLNYDKTMASGGYLCELGYKLRVFRSAPADGQMIVHWKGERVVMERNLASASGLPRYESHKAGLTWIDLPTKSMLLDQRSGRPLYSDCVALNDGAKDELEPAVMVASKGKVKGKKASAARKHIARK